MGFLTAGGIVVANGVFTEEQIDNLLKIEWWNWDDKKINDNTELLCNVDINKFINKHMVTSLYNSDQR